MTKILPDVSTPFMGAGAKFHRTFHTYMIATYPAQQWVGQNPYKYTTTAKLPVGLGERGAWESAALRGERLKVRSNELVRAAWSPQNFECLLWPAPVLFGRNKRPQQFPVEVRPRPPRFTTVVGAGFGFEIAFAYVMGRRFL